MTMPHAQSHANPLPSGSLVHACSPASLDPLRLTTASGCSDTAAGSQPELSHCCPHLGRNPAHATGSRRENRKSKWPGEDPWPRASHRRCVSEAGQRDRGPAAGFKVSEVGSGTWSGGNPPAGAASVGADVDGRRFAWTWVVGKTRGGGARQVKLSFLTRFANVQQTKRAICHIADAKQSSPKPGASPFSNLVP